ncbi:MAG: ATP-binding protein [Pseudomonadota bacterium]|nr:ATP-binding protein [Pseudomonadota bacterium]
MTLTATDAQARMRDRATGGSRPGGGDSPFRGLFLPVILMINLATIAIVAITWLAAERLDTDTERRDVALARTALKVEADRLRFIARDYTWWDTAIENLVDTVDTDWADNNIGSYLTDSARVALSAVLTVDGGTAIMFVDGQPREGPVTDLLGTDTARDLFDRANAMPMEAPEGVAAFARVDGRVYTLAASAFTPEYPEGEDLIRHTRPVLIVGSQLDEVFLDDASESYLLERLSIVDAAPGEAGAFAPITDRNGWAVAYLTWSPRLVGQTLVNDLLIPIVIGLGAMLALGALYFRRLRRATVATDAMSIALERERELRELKSRFISTVSHELRTPLATIQAAVDLLVHFGDRLSDEEKRKELAAISGRVRAIDGMLAESLALERQEVDTVTFEDFDPTAEIRASWANRLPTKGRQLDLRDTRERPGTVRLDRRLFTQAVVNLLSNALKYSRPDTPVRVVVADSGPGIAISVIDEGIGIPAADLSRVREPFHRGANAVDIGGVGFGLSIVERAASRLGGRLDIQSVEGQGTTATVSFALSQEVGLAA